MVSSKLSVIQGPGHWLAVVWRVVNSKLSVIQGPGHWLASINIICYL